MLKKTNRFDKKRDFNKTLKEGRKTQEVLFGLIWMKEEEGKKFGWIVSKKISLKAVERNRIKRRLATAIQKRLLNFPEGFRGIFLVRKGILGANLKMIEENIDRIVENF